MTDADRELTIDKHTLSQLGAQARDLLGLVERLATKNEDRLNELLFGLAHDEDFQARNLLRGITRAAGFLLTELEDEQGS